VRAITRKYRLRKNLNCSKRIYKPSEENVRTGIKINDSFGYLWEECDHVVLLIADLVMRIPPRGILLG